MVREESVKLMAKIAIYEKHKGRTEIPMNEYYKGDYVRVNTLKTIVSATISFVTIFAVWVLYKLDYLLANILKMDYKRLAVLIALIYCVWILMYWLIARIIYAKRYEDSRSNIIIYNHHLKKLQEEEDKKVMKAKGGMGIGDDFIDF